MNTLTLEGWCKPEGASKSTPIESIHFRVSEASHLLMEEAEERLKSSGERETFVAVAMATMELQTSDDCGPLSDCRLRVYLNPTDQRGHFHLVGHRASDGSLVYSNSLMVDTLG
ncbi:MAG: hypothetical protein ACR2PS_15635 [Pseudomonadales bacterium]